MEKILASNEHEVKEKPWILNIIGLLFFSGLPCWSYHDITRFEAEGGYLLLPRILKLMYDIFGKWDLVGVWLTGVLYNLVKGTISLSNNKA